MMHNSTLTRIKVHALKQKLTNLSQATIATGSLPTINHCRAPTKNELQFQSHWVFCTTNRFKNILVLLVSVTVPRCRLKRLLLHVMTLNISHRIWSCHNHITDDNVLPRTGLARLNGLFIKASQCNLCPSDWRRPCQYGHCVVKSTVDAGVATEGAVLAASSQMTGPRMKGQMG